MFHILAVGALLGKFEHEVLELTPRELARWLAYMVMNKEINQPTQSTGGGGQRRIIRSL